jgi:hypothetical protein
VSGIDQSPVPNPVGRKTDRRGADEDRHYRDALDGLPKLTRIVLTLSAMDDMAYPDIALRCGIPEEEVRIRLADALVGIGREMDGRHTLLGIARRALSPWRLVWAKARVREADRRIAPWLPMTDRPPRRRVIDQLARLYEAIRFS